ncbi:multidrug transporter subunit MdtD [Comamonas humi]
MTDSASRPASSMVLWLVAIGFFMQTLDATIVNTALPSMAASLGESPLRMQSVVVAYSLAMAMLIPASGWIADRFGAKRVFIGAIICFMLASLLCAMARTVDQLVAFRVLQGLGGALLLPVGRLVVLRSFPREEFLQAMSFVAIPGLIGPLVGPTLGGWLVELASWHWIFLINVPVGLIGVAAALRYMPTIDSPPVGRFDGVGYGMLAFGMVAVSLSLDGLSGMGMGRAAGLLLMLAGLASLAAYWLHALRHPGPLFSPQLFSVPTLRIGLLGNLFARLGSGSMPFLIPLLLQVTMDYSPMQAGMMMLPSALSGMAMKKAAVAVIGRFGYRRVLVGNTLLLGVLMASFALSSPAEPLAFKIAQLAVFGAINSMQFTAMNTVTLKDLNKTMASSGNSLLSMVQMVSLGMAVATAGAILTTFDGHGGAAVAGEHAQGAFQATFVCMGVITMLSALIFWQLAPQDENLRGQGSDQMDDAHDA